MSAQREERIAQAWNFLEVGELASAIKLGQELTAAHEEEGYRILAVAYAESGDIEEAIGVLENGTQVLPESWNLWLLMGTFLSDMELYEQANAAFEQALACPGVESGWIKINQAISLFRQEQFDAALNLLQSIKDEAVMLRAFALQLNILDQLGRHDLVLEMAQEELETLPVPATEEDAAHMSLICSSIATACWYEEREPAEIDHYLRQAIDFDRSNPDATWLIREMNPVFSDKAQSFELLVKGRFKDTMQVQTEEDPSPETFAAQEFVTTYEVIADNEDEALALIRQFEVSEVELDSLTIVESEVGEALAEEAKGVYVVGGFGFLEEGV